MDNETFLIDRNVSAAQLDGDVVRLPVARHKKNHRKDDRRKINAKAPHQISFDRRELSEILKVYGYYVSEGEWRDYAMDFQKDRAVFSIFKRASEMPIFRIEKDPNLSRKQGAYSVLNASGMILKRGHELRQVLKVLQPRKHLRVVD